ncbi:MAG: replicative DNA helicase [Lachnospiraceae bacterium]|nr:replicative DNA helicase [Lachnospiraceae bacterium]MBP5414180.1 replicative DNA helicase [Lachnospiraceae bacterium]MBP5745500.1 replicative DNA helicase [Lachnospiraceae bacterium]
MSEEAILRRTLPNSREAEQSVIGSMLIDREGIAVASEIISADDFYNKQLGIIFDAMVELYNEGKPVDPVTLQDRLKEKDVPPEVSSLEYIGNIVANVPTSYNLRSYAQIVADRSTLRKMIKLMGEIENTCYEAKEPMESILDTTERKVFELVQKRNTGEITPIRQVVVNALDRIQAAYMAKGTVTGIPTGFADLDYMTSGMQPSDLVLIAARPSMGKTAFVLNVAQHMAFKEKKGVVIFSLEMSKEQLVNRIFSLESRVDAQHLRNGKLDDNEWEKLVESAGVIGSSNLIIDDTPGISIGELRSKCRKYKMDHPLDIIIIDYLQLMTGSGRSDSRQQEISEISRSLKGLARELNVPVIALSQLSRAVEQRPDHRPMMSDLRESGAIEQDADVVMFIYREDYYNKDTEKKNISEIIIGKQRNGPVGTVELAWLPQYTMFRNLEKKRKEESQ